MDLEKQDLQKTAVIHGFRKTGSTNPSKSMDLGIHDLQDTS